MLLSQRAPATRRPLKWLAILAVWVVLVLLLASRDPAKSKELRAQATSADSDEAPTAAPAPAFTPTPTPASAPAPAFTPTPAPALHSAWSLDDWSAFFAAQESVSRADAAAPAQQQQHQSVRVLDTYLPPLLVPRNLGDPGHDQARQFLIDTLTSLRFDVVVDEFSAATPYNPQQVFRNIIATKHPNAIRKLVLSAHYDSKNVSSVLADAGVHPGSAEAYNATFIGATDSSVPCAVMLEVATLLNPLLEQLGSSPDTTLQLIFFDGEEAQIKWSHTDSTYGSRHLAELWQQQQKLDSISLFVLLDLLGAPNPAVHNYHHLGNSGRHVVQSASTQSPDETTDPYIRLARIERQLRDAKMMYNVGDLRTSKVSQRHDHAVLNLLRRHASVPDMSDAELLHQYRQRRSDDQPYFLLDHPGGGIEDDHVPFLDRGVPVLHLIPYPFPTVWHRLQDNADAVAPEVVINLSRVMTVFTKEYLNL
ncbi:hypothetical protein RI367_003920 [Sorochytrium milnesiophthora]